MVICCDIYELKQVIGKGSFGEVYNAIYKKTNEMVACKIELMNDKMKLYEEYTIYKKLQNNIHIPKIYDFVKLEKQHILGMELLTQSLDNLFIQKEKKIEINYCKNIAIQCIEILEYIHKKGIIHRDIKPNNFMLKNDIIYIIDFGLSCKYTNNDKHIAFSSNGPLIGTLRYASINVHLGITPSRRDDMESLGYMLIYLAKGSLPWQGLSGKNTGEQKQLVAAKKLCTSVNVLCDGLPDYFGKYIAYCRNLNFTDTPDYSFLINLFK